MNDAYDAVMNAYRSAHEEFACLPYDIQVSGMGDITARCVEWCTEYIYDHFDEFRLILMCSEVTRYNNMVDEMMKIEEEVTEKFMNLMRENGRESPYIDPLLAHMVTSGCFTSFFEIVRHSVPRDKAFTKKMPISAFSCRIQDSKLAFSCNFTHYHVAFPCSKNDNTVVKACHYRRNCSDAEKKNIR